MNAAVVVALIAALGSLAVTLAKSLMDAHGKKQERLLVEQAELRRYRTLLWSAADDLGNRINNIRNQNFLVYLNQIDRRNLALNSTLFRFGQYFGWTEIYRDYLRFNPARDTGTVSTALAKITIAFASDTIGREATLDAQLMLWREEQLAIGHLMRQEGEMPTCVGFDTFIDDYEAKYAKWFKKFAEQLAAAFSHGKDSARLAEIHHLLAELIVELDDEKVFVRLENGKIVTPLWARPSQYTSSIP
jgi:hypothetical protein